MQVQHEGLQLYLLDCGGETPLWILGRFQEKISKAVSSVIRHPVSPRNPNIDPVVCYKTREEFCAVIAASVPRTSDCVWYFVAPRCTGL
jgi:hypothetical protein